MCKSQHLTQRLILPPPPFFLYDIGREKSFANNGLGSHYDRCRGDQTLWNLEQCSSTRWLFSVRVDFPFPHFEPTVILKEIGSTAADL